MTAVLRQRRRYYVSGSDDVIIMSKTSFFHTFGPFLKKWSYQI